MDEWLICIWSGSRSDPDQDWHVNCQWLHRSACIFIQPGCLCGLVINLCSTIRLWSWSSMIMMIMIKYDHDQVWSSMIMIVRCCRSGWSDSDHQQHEWHPPAKIIYMCVCCKCVGLGGGGVIYSVDYDQLMIINRLDMQFLLTDNLHLGIPCRARVSLVRHFSSD